MNCRVSGAREAGGTVSVDGWDELVDPMARVVESVVLQGLGSPAQFQQSPDEQGRPRHPSARIDKTLLQGDLFLHTTE